MSRTLKGIYEAVNIDKTGTPKAHYKSSWELAFMKMCDAHPAIIKWAYEPIRIPYVNPITQKNTVYVPDFLVVFIDKKMKQKIQIIEVKPSKQAHMGKARTQDDKIQLAVNTAKWEAATRYAKAHGMTFRVVTEYDIYRNPK